MVSDLLPSARILVVDDNPGICAVLKDVLEFKGYDPVVCSNPAQALRISENESFGLAFVDINLPGMSGLDLIKRLRPKYPELKLLVISMREEQLYAARVLRAGGDGYVMKQQDPEEIIDAIRDVLAGRIYVSEEVLASGSKISRAGRPQPRSRPIDRLSDLELEILGLLGAGKSNPEIASHLDLNARSLAGHYAKMRKKLSLNNTNALIRFAVCWTGSGET